MRRRGARIVLCVLLLSAWLALGTVSQAAAADQLPYGKYQGTAAGGGSGGGDAFAITVYVSPASGGQVRITGVTSKIPIPIDVFGTPAKAGDGWDIPVAVDMSSVQLSGSGVVHLRPSGGGWEMFGSGSGSFRGKSGSGKASATRVSTQTSVGAQVLDALQGFVSGPPDEGPVAPPKDFQEPGGSQPQPASGGAATQPAGGATDAPPSVEDEGVSFFFWFLFACMGLFI